MRILLMFWLLMATSLGAAAQDWTPAPLVAGIEGLPLMPGLEEITDETVVFDKPEGRVVEARLYGALEAGAVLAWYDETLAALGWQVRSGGDDRRLRVWRRDEALSIRFTPVKGGTEVAVSLAPLQPG